MGNPKRQEFRFVYNDSRVKTTIIRGGKGRVNGSRGGSFVWGREGENGGRLTGVSIAVR